MCSCTMELNVKTSRHSTKDIMTLRLSYLKETISPNALILISVFQVGERTQRGVTNLPQDFWGMSAVSARPVIRTLCKLRVNSSDQAAREDVGKKVRVMDHRAVARMTAVRRHMSCISQTPRRRSRLPQASRSRSAGQNRAGLERVYCTVVALWPLLPV